MGQPGLFSFIFTFQTNITSFSTNRCEKCPVTIRSWDSDPHPSEHVSFIMTTRPGLPPTASFITADQLILMCMA